jgi:hypothetical protein
MEDRRNSIGVLKPPNLQFVTFKFWWLPVLLDSFVVCDAWLAASCPAWTCAGHRAVRVAGQPVQPLAPAA